MAEWAQLTNMIRKPRRSQRSGCFRTGPHPRHSKDDSVQKKMVAFFFGKWGHVYHWRELPQVSFLSRQNTSFVDKVATKLLSRQNYVCRYKHVFFATKMILVAALANDICRHQSSCGQTKSPCGLLREPLSPEGLRSLVQRRPKTGPRGPLF